VTLEGWGWVPNTIVSPHHSRERSARLRDAQAAHPQHTGLGLPEDVALALGPHGEAERWGSGEIEVVTPQ
jgi:cyanophycinase-like exopeptidase